MPFTVSASPAPLTFTIWPRLQFQLLAALSEAIFLGWLISRRGIAFQDYEFIVIAIAALSWLLVIIRRERIEIYPDEFRFEKLWLGFPQRKSLPADDVYGVSWVDGRYEGDKRRPSYIQFSTAESFINAGYTLSFEDYEAFRSEVRRMYPDLDRRWGRSRRRSSHLTLLDLS